MEIKNISYILFVALVLFSIKDGYLAALEPSVPEEPITELADEAVSPPLEMPITTTTPVMTTTLKNAGLRQRTKSSNNRHLKKCTCKFCKMGGMCSNCRNCQYWIRLHQQHQQKLRSQKTI